MSFRLGFEGTLMYKAGGQGAGGNWAELTNCKDVTLNVEKGEADATTRANDGWKATVAALKDGSIEWEMVWDTDDAGFTAIKDSFFDDTIIGLQVLDTDGGEGLQADFMITNFSRAEALEDVMKVSVTAKVTYSDTPPSWIGE